MKTFMTMIVELDEKEQVEIKKPYIKRMVEEGHLFFPYDTVGVIGTETGGFMLVGFNRRDIRLVQQYFPGIAKTMLQDLEPEGEG